MVCQILMASVNVIRDLVATTAAKNNAHWDCQINLQKLKRNAAVISMGNATLKLEYAPANRVLVDSHVNLVAHLAHHLTAGSLLTIKERTLQQKVHYGTKVGHLLD